MRPGPATGFRALGALAATLLAVSGCRATGGTSAAYVASLPSDLASLAPKPERAPVDLLEATSLPDVDVASVDEILYSATSVDPVLREAAGSWQNEWRTSEAQSFQRYLERMERYELVVDAHIEARALPRSLRYLPLIESGYSTGAVSRVGATGLWQLMGPTARELGLTVNSIVDDRRDPVASTVAALEYLERLHEEFGSWLLALAAYNGGPGRVRRALTRSDAGATLTGDELFLEIRGRLPLETREFIPRFLAAAALAEDPGAHGFSPGESDPLSFDEVTVSDATSLDVVAKAAEVPEETIRLLNPQFVRGYTPRGERRTIRVPVGTVNRFTRNFAAIPPEERLSFMEHVVASGETFGHIAGQYGVPVSEVVDTNRHLDPRRLQIGMIVVVPLRGMRSGSGLRAGG